MTVASQRIANLPSLNIEQKILCDEFFKRFDQDNGAAFDVINVEPLLYEGAIAGSEFLTYGANKLYLCFDSVFSYSGAADVFNGQIRFYNELNAIHLYSQNQSIAYESVAAAIYYQKNNIFLKNHYFSRIVAANINYMKFIGYRITY